MFSEPKTSASRRTVALDTHTLAALREHRQRQMLERALMGDAYEENDLIFAREDGRPIEPRYVSERFDSLAKEAKLARIRFHDLRHTHATLALQAGVHPKVVQERLGHSDISITLQRPTRTCCQECRRRQRSRWRRFCSATLAKCEEQPLRNG